MSNQQKINLLTLLQTLNETIDKLNQTLQTIQTDCKTEMQSLTKTLGTIQLTLANIHAEMAKPPPPPEIAPAVTWPVPPRGE